MKLVIWSTENIFFQERLNMALPIKLFNSLAQSQATSGNTITIRWLKFQASLKLSLHMLTTALVIPQP